MKIKDVKGTILAPPEYSDGAFLIIEITSDEELTGIGEGFAYCIHGDAVHAAKTILDMSLKKILLGKDPLNIEQLWIEMAKNTEYNARRHGIEMSAISGVDMALWDLKGKALGKPVYELLGGQYRDKVRVYVSALFNMSNKQYTLKEAVRYVDEGFTALKFGYGGFGFNYKNDIAMIKDLRDFIGYDIDLMVDGPVTLNYSRALKLAKAMEKYDIFWWEEPLIREDLEGYAKLAASTDIRIAAGEGERTYYGFKDLIDKEAADVLQPDLSWVGGLTEAKKIAELAYHTNKEWVPHNWGTVINTAASLHLVASRPDGFICEYGIGPRTMEDAAPEEGLGPSPMMVELLKEPFKVTNGFITIPKEPGLGIELNQQALEKWRSH